VCLSPQSKPVERYASLLRPDRSTLRTVFRDTFRSRAISRIVLPLMKCSLDRDGLRQSLRRDERARNRTRQAHRVIKPVPFGWHIQQDWDVPWQLTMTRDTPLALRVAKMNEVVEVPRP
jgi:hypothetical protein